MGVGRWALGHRFSDSVFPAGAAATDDLAGRRFLGDDLRTTYPYRGVLDGVRASAARRGGGSLEDVDGSLGVCRIVCCASDPVFGHLSWSFLQAMGGLDPWCKRGYITFWHVCTTTVKVSVDLRWFGDRWAPLHHSDSEFCEISSSGSILANPLRGTEWATA